jgi:hypothetical protein
MTACDALSHFGPDDFEPVCLHGNGGKKAYFCSQNWLEIIGLVWVSWQELNCTEIEGTPMSYFVVFIILVLGVAWNWFYVW